MGYYTEYNLDVGYADDEQFNQIVSALREKHVIGNALNDHLNSYQKTKWYNWKQDMKDVSALFPDVHFTLSGEGETNSDIWEAHFVAGKMQVCKAEIVIPPFDPKKLE